MNFIQKIKESPHYERLKNSAEYRYCRRQGILFTVIMLIYGLATFLPAFFLEDELDASFVILILFFLIFFGMWIYYCYRWLEIFLYMEHYTFCQVRMEKIHLQGRGIACFTVEFTDRQGRTQIRDTANMFSSQWEPYVEAYNNKMALIGYNEKTDRLVVIKNLSL